MQFKMENELDLHFSQVELRASPYSNLHDMQSELPLPIYRGSNITQDRTCYVYLNNIILR